MPSFSNQVKAFSKKAEARYRATARTAVQDTIDMAQRPRGDGGRLPIVTGFLRASIQASQNTMPSGPTTNEKNKKFPLGTQVAGEPVAMTLLKWDPSTRQTLFVGWSAVYSRAMESRYGFLRGAAEVWDQTVAKAAKKVEAGLG